jgi:hypothetical protein
MLGFSACLSSFAQGSLSFLNNSSSLVWDGFTTPSAFVKAGATLEVAVMWSADSNAVPTNFRSGVATPTNGVYVSSWTGIFTDPNFQLAHSTTAGNPVIVSTCGGIGPAAGMYQGGVQFINGTSVGQVIGLYVIGWDRSFGTDPVAASAGGAAVGFSQVIQYQVGSQVVLGVPLGGAGIGPFGVAAAPEPSTFALAGLGSAALLIFRRRRNS